MTSTPTPVRLAPTPPRTPSLGATLRAPQPAVRAAVDPVEARRIACIRVWDALFRGARRQVERDGFIGVHNMPEIVGVTGACENVDTLFRLDFFGQQAYLAQSDQLYLELLTPQLGRCYAEMQSFRMEHEADARHLCQFALFELEMLGDLDLLLDHVEAVVRSACAEAAARCADSLEAFGRDAGQLARLPRFARMTYTDAIAMLQPDFPDLAWGDDLGAAQELVLTERFGPMFLTHYPLPIKFFNMRQNERDPRVVNSADLLLPKAGEAAGGAEREHDHDRIVERLHASTMYRRLIDLGGRDEDFAWYLDAHRDREVPLHSGAGIGMARVAQFVLGCDDIRDAVPFVINREQLL